MKMKLFGPTGGWVPGASLFSPLKMYVNPDVEPEFPLDGGERASPSPPPPQEDVHLWVKKVWSVG